MRLHCSLKVENLISSFSIVDKKIFSLLITLSLAFMIGLWSERELFNFFMMLLASCPSYDHLLFLTLFYSTLVQPLSVVYLLSLRVLWLRDWWLSGGWSAPLPWFDIIYFEIFDIIVFKRQIWIRASVRIRSPCLLLGLHLLYRTSVQSLMDWPTVELAPLCLCLLFLLFHDMPRASRDYRTVHSVAGCASIF